MTSSSDSPMRTAPVLRSATRVLRGEAVDHAHVTRFTVDPARNRRSTDKLPPIDEQLATARRDGWDEGYQAGLDAARATAESRGAEAVQRAAEVLRELARTTAAVQAHAVSVVTRDATELAFELTRTLVGHELAASASPGLGAVCRALRLASPDQELTVRLHPDEVIEADVLQSLVPECRLVILPDANIEPGGCIVDAGPCRIDAQIQPALERVRSVLFSELTSTNDVAVGQANGNARIEHGGNGNGTVATGSNGSTAHEANGNGTIAPDGNGNGRVAPDGNGNGRVAPDGNGNGTIATGSNGNRIVTVAVGANGPEGAGGAAQ